MKLKYYLRGLGVGIAVTALILGIATLAGKNDNSMTDEEVIARAKELGMTERTVLAESVQPEASSTEEESVVEEESSFEEESSIEEESTSAEEEVLEESTDASMEESTEESAEPVSEEVIDFQIARGDSSVSVSRRLEEAGLVEDATACDSYLCQNGYDKNIQTGTYEIPVNASLEQIAKLITGN